MNCKHCKNTIPEASIFCNWCGGRQIAEPRRKDFIKVPTPRRLPSGNWNIQLRAERRSVTEPTAALARARAVAIRAGFIAQRRSGAAGRTLGQAVDDYIAGRSSILSPSTVKAYKAYRRNRFAALMERPVKAITAKEVQSAVNRELNVPANPSGRGSGRSGGTLSGKTVINAYGLIRTVLTLETDIDLSRIVLPRADEKAGCTLHPEQIGTLIRAVEGDAIEVPVLLSVWLGLRRSEVAALKKSDFDFTGKTVSIHAALVQNDENRWVEKSTKTRTSTRTLACPDYILEKTARLPEGNILTVHPNTLYIKLRRICSRESLPQVRFHDLRHCAASMMLLLGVPDKYAMERGGWASRRVMTGRYQHTVDSQTRAISRTIDDFYMGLIGA